MCILGPNFLTRIYQAPWASLRCLDQMRISYLRSLIYTAWHGELRFLVTCLKMMIDHCHNTWCHKITIRSDLIEVELTLIKILRNSFIGEIHSQITLSTACIITSILKLFLQLQEKPTAHIRGYNNKSELLDEYNIIFSLPISLLHFKMVDSKCVSFFQK